MYCARATPTQHSLSNRDTRQMRVRLGAQAGKHVLVRVQPRGKVPANYALQQTDDCPCNTEGGTEFNWRMRWPMSAMEKAPTLHIAVGNSYGANDTLAEGELSLEALCERAAKRRTGQFLDTWAKYKSPTNRDPQLQPHTATAPQP